jgi:hypothetical protein
MICIYFISIKFSTRTRVSIYIILDKLLVHDLRSKFIAFRLASYSPWVFSKL